MLGGPGDVWATQQSCHGGSRRCRIAPRRQTPFQTLTGACKSHGRAHRRQPEGHRRHAANPGRPAAARRRPSWGQARGALTKLLAWPANSASAASSYGMPYQLVCLHSDEWLGTAAACAQVIARLAGMLAGLRGAHPLHIEASRRTCRRHASFPHETNAAAAAQTSFCGAAHRRTRPSIPAVASTWAGPCGPRSLLVLHSRLLICRADE